MAESDYGNALEPYLPVGCSTQCEKISKEIEIVEFNKCLSFYKEAQTPTIKAERLKTGTFFVTNNGRGRITVVLETGAGQCSFVKDNKTVIDEGECAAIVGKYYGKYYRLRFFAEGCGAAAVHFIAQYYGRF